MVSRIDTDLIKHDHPVEDVVAGYGIELRPSGRTLTGRCPFHPDHGRPNLAVYPASRSWYCFRCGCGGDVISFVERMERVGFREALMRLDGKHALLRPIRISPVQRQMPRKQARRWGPGERACLAAAVDLYHNQLLGNPAALAYVEGRGIDRTTVEQCRVGYAAGDELASYLRWRRLPAQAAMRVGLLGRDGREFLAGRIVVPEIRGGQPIWLIGRTLNAQPDLSVPKYLGLPGRKPLLGWEAAAVSTSIYLVEGVFDWLTLHSWGLPALALAGTRLRPEARRALERFERMYLVLDSDEAGQTATAQLFQELGRRALPVALPGVKDVAELAVRPGGRSIFTRLIGQLHHPEPEFARAA